MVDGSGGVSPLSATAMVGDMNRRDLSLVRRDALVAPAFVEDSYYCDIKDDSPDLPVPGTKTQLDTLTIHLSSIQSASSLQQVATTLTRLGQPDGISPSRMAEILEVDKPEPKVRC